jgi:hypothetical protein
VRGVALSLLCVVWLAAHMQAFADQGADLSTLRKAAINRLQRNFISRQRGVCRTRKWLKLLRRSRRRKQGYWTILTSLNFPLSP